MSTRFIFRLEIAVGNGQLEALACAGFAGRRVLEGLVFALETILNLAVFGTAVAILLIAIVAILARILVAVTTRERTGLVLALVVATLGFKGAGLGTTLAVAVEEAVLVLAKVAELAGLLHPVSAFRLNAGLPHVWTGGAGLDLAGTGAAVIALVVAVVASLAPDLLPITTERDTTLSWNATLIAILDGLTIGRTAVPTVRIAVVTGFVGGQNLVSAFSLIDAWLSRVWTLPVGFDLAQLVATIAGVFVPVIALLAFVLIQRAIATFRVVDCDRGGATGGHAEIPATSAATRSTAMSVASPFATPPPTAA